MFEVRFNNKISMYPTKEEITKNKIKASVSYHIDLQDSSKNKTIDIRYFYNKNNDITAKIINDNNKETIHTYCYEDNALKLVYRNGLLWKEFSSENVYMLYTNNKSYKIEDERVKEIYDKSGILDVIAYVYDSNNKVITESGVHYTTEYLYNRNGRLKRIIHTINDKVVKDMLIVYKRGNYELENLLTRCVTYVKTNKLGFPSKITTYDKNNVKIGYVHIQYTLDDDIII